MSQKKTRCTAVLLAAGQGRRMGGEIPKQYIKLGGMPIMLHSLRTFTEGNVITDVVIVVPPGDEEYCAQLCARYSLSAKVRSIIPGGAQRYDTVYNGLMAITWKCDYVFIHDCARPFITEENLRALLDEVRVHKACAAAVPANDTIKISNAAGFVEYTPVRSSVWIVQTPQVFDCKLITEAHKKMREDPGVNEGAVTIGTVGDPTDAPTVDVPYELSVGSRSHQAGQGVQTAGSLTLNNGILAATNTLMIGYYNGNPDDQPDTQDRKSVV